MLKNLWLLLSAAAAYFLFNREYFAFAEAALAGEPPRRGTVNLFFVLNYLVFLACSLLQLHLMFNWALFGLLLFLETLVCFRCPLLHGVFFALQGILCGLSSNILNRCFIALLLNEPLAVFDNHVRAAGNLKSYPVVVGFLSTALIFLLFTRPRRREEIRLLLAYPRHLGFLVRLMSVMYAYLLLHLLLYGPNENELILKLWGIFSCGFVCVGYYLSLLYIQRLCRLSRFREENHRLRREVADRQREEEQLSQNAYRDDLTGLFNRKYLQEVLAQQLGSPSPFCLCFADLDGLKTVNDRFGHSAGDAYLLAAARALRRACRRKDDLLFRYGGDEFIALLFGLSPEAAGERMERVNQLLLEAERETGGFPMSVSYGVTSSADTSSLEALIQAADSRMYSQKRIRCRTRGDTAP